ncbi:MAG: SpoIVB peptidase S55 [Acidobacteriota bacterium]|nr:SpoIVB peptidase S55 [Acidobacteriota bacterium]
MLSGAALAQSSALPAHAPAVTQFFPEDQIRAGLHGVAYTVFQGVTPEPMAVEILGRLKDALGPGEDMILARLQGERPEYTGVVAGMSGSPVYIDGKLVGALSYRIGQFSKEPIAGITPIAQMLQVRDDATAPRTGGSGGSTEMHAMETPLVFGSGYSAQAVTQFAERFRALGLEPVAGLGSADSEARQPEPLEPGSAVSAVLVRGDLSMAGTCTVTYLDATNLLACGHPITQAGPVELPMTKATIVATLPSPLNAFKIVNTTETVGAFTQDRANAVLGRFGQQARMIPVTVEVQLAGSPGPARTMHFEVLDNAKLTTPTMLVSIYQCLQQSNTAAAEMTYRLDGSIRVADQQPVRLHQVLGATASSTAEVNTALYVGERFDVLYANTVQRARVEGLELHIVAQPARHTAVLESARLSRQEARPGDELEAEAVLQPYRAPEQIVRLRFRLPTTLAAGDLRVVVSDGATVDRLLRGSSGDHAVALQDTVAMLNATHPDDAVYVTLLDHQPQAELTTRTLVDVPLSVVNVMQPLKDAQQLQLNGESVLEATQRPTADATSGFAVLHLTVRP